jgi:hypothetical protein
VGDLEPPPPRRQRVHGAEYPAANDHYMSDHVH